MQHAKRSIAAVAGIGAAILLSACGGSAATSANTTAAQGTSPGKVIATPSAAGSSAQSAVPPQSPVPPENNPPGDIPDNTAFVPYRSQPGGFEVKVPEGWARSTSASSVTFVSTLNSITLSWPKAPAAPTVATARSTEVPALQSSSLAFHLQSVKAVSLSGGPAIEIVYQANSKANSVTGKQYRLVIERFELFRGGTEAILSLSSPVGADNVDPWRTVSESFRWV